MRQGWTRLAWAVFATTIAASVTARVMGDEYYLSEERLGTRTVPLLLLSRPDVRAELKLTPAQETSALSAIDALYKKAESLRGKPNAPEVLTARREIDQAQGRWIAEELMPDQVNRLTQLDLQWEGPAALVTRKLVAETVGLTENQRRRIEESAREARAAVSRGAVGPRQAEAALARATLGALGEDQRERWKAMLGTPFAFEKIAARPGRSAAKTRTLQR